MPANEQTWRDLKLMHVVFGISSVAMLVTTIWMLAADHRREWKGYQRKFQEVEAWTAQARIGQQESSEYYKELDDLRKALAAAQQAVPEQDLIDRFKQAVVDDWTRRQETEKGFKEKEPDFARLD